MSAEQIALWFASATALANSIAVLTLAWVMWRRAVTMENLARDLHKIFESYQRLIFHAADPAGKKKAGAA